MNGSTTEIELLAWEGCPSHPKAMQLIRHTLRQIGMDHVEVKLRFIGTDEQAVAERFVGSPTFRVNGTDLIPPGGSEPYGLTCRLYRRRDGRFSPTPDPDDLRDGAIKALLGEEVPAGRIAPARPAGS